MMKTARQFSLLLFGFLFCFSAFPQKGSTPLSNDGAFKVGKLENGLTYFIRRNPKPENKLELRLVIKAGSLQEKDHQQGLAHFTEHMCFNGTEHFPKNELVDYLQSVGVKFGAHLNAYTSFEETVYILPIPSKDPEIIEKGFQILEDWASKVTFSQEEIDKERGVVIEEWRLGQGAQQRMREQYFPVLFEGSRYAERLPIGKKDILENFKMEDLTSFYETWYRPDLMAVIAVGDVAEDSLENYIKAHFSGLKSPEKAEQKEFYPIPDQQKPAVVIAKDEEASFLQAQVIFKHDSMYVDTEEEFFESLKVSIYETMLAGRLNELTQLADPPFIFGGFYDGPLTLTKSAFQGITVTGNEDLEKGFKALMTEFARARNFGFTESELERTKARFLAGYQQAFQEKDKQESGKLVDEALNFFLNGTAFPGIEKEYELVKQFLPVISLQDVNTLSDRFYQVMNQVFIITGPDKEDVIYPSEEEVLEWVEEVQNEDLKAYVDEVGATELMEKTPASGKLVSEVEIPQVGIWKWTFENGAEVYVKPTDFKNDEILFTAFSEGGYGAYPMEKYFSAQYADQVVSQSGVGGFTSVEMDKMLAGKVAGVSAYISQQAEGVSGGSNSKDFETLMQLVYLHFTDPTFDENAFLSMKKRNAQLFENLMADPGFWFSEEVNKVLSQNHPKGGGYPTPEDMEQIKHQEALTIYKERFANAADFRFFLVGNFDPEATKELLARYIGSLPSSVKREKVSDLGIRPPEGKIERTFRKGKEEKASVRIYFYDRLKEYDRYQNLVASTMAEILTIKLTERLRERESGVYGVGASSGLNYIPYPKFQSSISFGCAPEKVDLLIDAAMEELEKIKKKGPEEADLNKVKEAKLKDWEESLRENRYWLNALLSYVRQDLDLKQIPNGKAAINRLKTKEIKKAARQYFSEKQMAKFILLPESGNTE